MERTMEKTIINQYGKLLDIEKTKKEYDPEIKKEVEKENLKTEQEFFNKYCIKHKQKHDQEFFWNSFLSKLENQ